MRNFGEYRKERNRNQIREAKRKFEEYMESRGYEIEMNNTVRENIQEVFELMENRDERVEKEIMELLNQKKEEKDDRFEEYKKTLKPLTEVEVTKKELISALLSEGKIKLSKKLKEEKILDEKKVLGKAELETLEYRYEKYRDYITLSEERGEVRNYYQMLYNLRKMYNNVKNGTYIHFPSMEKLYNNIEENYKIGKPTYLIGETGGGKTAFAKEFLREKNGQEPILISCNPETGTTELVASKEIVVESFKDEKGEEKQFPVIKSILQGLQKAAKEGRGVILDEANKLSPDTLGMLNEYLSLNMKRGNKAKTQMNGGEEYSVHKDFYVILTGNEGEIYKARNDLDASTKRRVDTQEYPYLEQREIAYMMIGGMGERDEIRGEENLPEKIEAITKTFSELQKQFTENRNERDEEKKRFVYRIPSPDIGRIVEIINRSKTNKNKSIEEIIYESYIKQTIYDREVQIYLFSQFRKNGLFRGFKGSIPTKIEDLISKSPEEQKKFMEMIDSVEGTTNKREKKTKVFEKMELIKRYHTEVNWEEREESGETASLRGESGEKSVTIDLSVLERELELTQKEREEKMNKYAPDIAKAFYDSCNDEDKEKLRKQFIYEGTTSRGTSIVKIKDRDGNALFRSYGLLKPTTDRYFVEEKYTDDLGNKVKNIEAQRRDWFETGIKRDDTEKLYALPKGSYPLKESIINQHTELRGERISGGSKEDREEKIFANMPDVKTGKSEELKGMQICRQMLGISGHIWTNSKISSHDARKFRLLPEDADRFDLNVDFNELSVCVLGDL